MMVREASWPAVDPVTLAADEGPDRTALVDAHTGAAWSYGELVDGPVGTLAGGLDGLGLESGDHLGVIAEPGIELAQLVHATARVGLVFCPLPPDAPAEVIAERTAAADVDALVVGDGAADSSAFDGPVRSLADLRATDGPPRAQPWRAGDVQWLVFTSGTTAEPRPVQLTAENLVASATASADRLGVEPSDRWLACLPMHHVGGLAPLFRSALYGTAVAVQRGFDAAETAEILDREPITGVSLVPTMLTRLLDAGWTPTDPLRFVLLGGAPASEELIERCRDAGVPVHPTYGATETASQVATARPATAFAHPGTVGRPLSGTTVTVTDGAGGPVPAGTVGELVVGGPTVSPGYYGDPAATEDRFDAGAFRTRDRGYLDDDGRLWVVGRLDDAIVTGGETVQPDVVERALRSHPAVEAAAVVALDDDEWGEVVAALVVAADPSAIDTAALRAHARDRLEPTAVPKLLATAGSLPRTVSGTVDRGAVRERLREARRRDGL